MQQEERASERRTDAACCAVLRFASLRPAVVSEQQRGAAVRAVAVSVWLWLRLRACGRGRGGLDYASVSASACVWSHGGQAAATRADGWRHPGQLRHETMGCDALLCAALFDCAARVSVFIEFSQRRTIWRPSRMEFFLLSSPIS